MSRHAGAAAKRERLNMRATREERELLGRAAEESRMTMSQFVLRAAVASAEEVLADRTRFVLPGDKWEAFVRALDRPARVVPALAEAAAKASPFVAG